MRLENLKPTLQIFFARDDVWDDLGGGKQVKLKQLIHQDEIVMNVK